jgi:hypothetical protein
MNGNRTTEVKINKDHWSKGVQPTSEKHPIQDLPKWDYTFNDIKKEYIAIILLKDLLKQWISRNVFGKCLYSELEYVSILVDKKNSWKDWEKSRITVKIRHNSYKASSEFKTTFETSWLHLLRLCDTMTNWNPFPFKHDTWIK